MQDAAKKYEFTGLTRTLEGRTLRQIRALRSLELSDVAAGEVGGWIEKEANLSHAGECWVYPDACIFEDAVVEGDCRIADRAVVRGRARLSGFILMDDDSEVTDDAVVENVARLSSTTQIYGAAVIACGQDGPQILPGIQIDFDVSYGQEYVTFGTGYSGYLVAVSSTGRVCVAGTYQTERWAGTVQEFEVWAAQYDDDPEVNWLAQCVRLYAQQQGLT
ncbi:MAG: hypothetical protein Q4C89_02075 [Deinococcus sp.]|uniref:hypothetical protein n=1 Tax=Deinococcus sp. TaxID=47478 RepID=UPI0026DDA2EF|nr:hypothetical protein [Deinococcus sp.]MDO4244793.1 hypothetical protein [Deinococcus sp.]